MNIIPVIFGLVTTVIVLFALICDVTDPGWPEPHQIRRSFRTRPKSEKKDVHSSDKDSDVEADVKETDQLVPGGTFENLFWFIQLSDTHFSIFKDKKRGPDLMRFCDNQLSVIHPRFVLVSGDIVDAKSMDTFGSKQYREEWQIYKQVTDTCTKRVDGQWYETRGNHDVFDVPHFTSSNNYYRQYSVQTKFRNQTSYMFDFKTDFGHYSFIAMDACLVPGPRRPFNFFGQLRDEDVKRLSEFSRKSHGSNLTIWFGHYPTSFIVYPNIRSLMSGGIAYLCGHLHTLGGLVEKMYTRQKTGMLELELGDWRDNRMFRVLAIDHDLLSFTDEIVEQWPIILITNPKNAQFLAPRHEPLHRIGMSTHIRILVFNPVALKYVNVSIDGQFIGSAEPVKDNLYVLAWEANKYSVGLHEIMVTVKDIKSNSRTVSQTFSINYSQHKFALVPKLLLMMNLFDVGKILFWSLFSIWLAVLILLRRCSNIRPYLLVSNVPVINVICWWCNLWLRALWKLTQIDQLFYITLIMFVYVGVGPWFIGEFLKDSIGFMFVWGIVVLNTLIPGSFTYFFGIFQIFTFNIPLACYLGYYYDRVNYKYRCWLESAESQGQDSFRPSFWWLVIMDIPLIILFLLQFYLALSGFPKAYGIMAFYLSPVRTWSALMVFPLNLIAYRQACRKTSSRASTSSR